MGAIDEDKVGLTPYRFFYQLNIASMSNILAHKYSSLPIITDNNP